MNVHVQFPEEAYLRAHPDVAVAVMRREFRSGMHHYATHGRREGRTLGDGSTPIDMGDVSPEMVTAAMSVLEPVLEGYARDLYLAMERAKRKAP